MEESVVSGLVRGGQALALANTSGGRFVYNFYLGLDKVSGLDGYTAERRFYLALLGRVSSIFDRVDVYIIQG